MKTTDNDTSSADFVCGAPPRAPCAAGMIAGTDALLSSRRRLLLAVVGAAALGSGCGSRRAAGVDLPTALHFTGATMGSTFSVRIAGGPFADGHEQAARTAVADAFDSVVSRMSTYDAASELSRFNRHAATTPFALSPPTMQVLTLAREISAVTDGAFDVTVSPIVDAWGFGAGSATPRAPAASLPTAPLGWQRLVLDTAASHASKLHPALQADLSGIAKGHAVDLAGRALEALGFARYMVEAGGEVRTAGVNAEGRPWRIGVERPDAWPQRVQRVVPLQGRAMATSGDYRNCYEVGGRRYCHEIDPATRAPIRHTLASVTVVADDCARADALATGLIVLGPERGPALARALSLSALFIVRDAPGVLREIATPAFAELGAVG